MRQGSAQLLRFESKRAGLALVSYPAVRVDQINPVGPTCVCAFSRVAELVKNARELYTQFSHASPCYVSTLVFVLWTRKHDLVFDVALHLPDITRMRLGDVDNEKSNAVPILFIKFV